MKTYICLLRGINVSGHKKIKMADLRIQLANLGLSEVTTYIQSGNVIFDSDQQDANQLADEIKQMIMTVYGHDVPVLVRSSDYWSRVAAKHPFIQTGEEPLNQVVVTFLKGIPAQEHLESIKDYVYKEDVFLIRDDAIFIYCPGGYGNTKLSNTFFERKLKVQATTRNWKTVLKLTEMLGAREE